MSGSARASAAIGCPTTRWLAHVPVGWAWKMIRRASSTRGRVRIPDLGAVRSERIAEHDRVRASQPRRPEQVVERRLGWIHRLRVPTSVVVHTDDKVVPPTAPERYVPALLRAHRWVARGVDAATVAA